MATAVMKEHTAVRVRNTTVELFRIICMLMVIASHCVIHGGAYTMDNGVNKWISMMILPAGKICFDAFVAIRAWYTVDAKFKAGRFVKVWLQILFYNLVFTALTIKFSEEYTDPITFRDWLGCFFPMLGNSHGFAASYAMYYLLVPFLAMLAHQLTKQQTRLLVGLLFAMQVFSSLLGSITRYYQPMPSEVLLFVLFYYVALYLKRWPTKAQNNKLLLSFVVVCTWLFIMTCRIGNALYPESQLFLSGIEITGNESSLGNILAGFSLFLLVKDIKMPYVPEINAIASTTFGVLLYHDHNFFRPVVWHRFIKASTWYYEPPFRFVVYIIISTLFVFTAGMLFDFVRQFLEKRVFRLKIVGVACEKFEQVICNERES